jgi:hypothetical protein
LREEILGLGGIGLHIGNYPNYQLNIPNKIKSKNKAEAFFDVHLQPHLFAAAATSLIVLYCGISAFD